MKTSRLIRNLIILLFVFPIAAAVIAPPDAICQIIIAVEMAVVYGLLALVIYRFKSLGQTPENVKKLIFVLVCLLSVSTVYSVTFYQYYYRMRIESRGKEASATTKADMRPTGLNAVQVLAVAKGQESGQSELRQLMTERRAILNRIVGKMEVHLEAGRIGIDEFMDANIALVRAELDLCKTKSERLEVLQKMVQFLTTCEGMVAKRAAAGRATEVDVDKAKAARLQAQIELARERMTK